MVAAAALLAAPALAGPGAGVHAAWVTEAVRAGTSAPSLALAADGAPRVAFSDASVVLYGARGPYGWSFEVVATGMDPALALDGDGRAHVAYVGGSLGPYPLEYARLAPEGWATETVDPEGGVFAPRVALGPGDAPQVLYRVVAPPGRQEIRHAERTPDGWRVETVAHRALGNAGFALGPDGAPHAAYVADGALRLARRGPDGAWTHETILATTAYFVDLAVGPDGVPHVAFSLDDERLLLASREGAGWRVERVDDDAPTGRHPAVAVLPDGRPAVAYYQVIDRGWPDNPLRGHVRYAERGPLGWLAQTVDPVGVNDRPDLAVDALGQPHVAHHRQRHQHPDLLGDGEQRILYARPLLAAALGRASDGLP